MVYAPEAITRTTAPATWTGLLRQRRRWLWGNLQNAWKHRSALLRGNAPLRFIALPNWWFINLGVFLLMPAWLAYLPHALTHYGGSTALTIMAIALAFETAHAWLGHALDREGGLALALAPVQRLIWPVFLWFVFASVVVSWLGGTQVGWRTSRARPSVVPPSPGRRRD